MEHLDDSAIRRGLAALGARLGLGHAVEILIVGGAAGILTRELPAAMTTMDADAMCFHPAKDRDSVLEAAAVVSQELSLPSDWLNEWSGLYAWTLPEGWKSRRVRVGAYGRLMVYAVGRLDLIAMKFIAHRERDRDHLAYLNVTPGDLNFVRAYLDSLSHKYPRSRFPAESGKIDLARRYVDAWKGAQ
jgi:uncharacterized nucleotidyltransferase DUF6036